MSINGKRQYLSDYNHKQYCEGRIFSLRPSTSQDIELEDVFHPDILGSMKDFLKKDLDETLDCFYYELWTATSLMCFRILERVLKTHINCDLEVEDEINNFWQCIKTLEEYEYDAEFLQTLDTIRESRNLGMHGEKRFSPKDAKELVHKTFYLVSWIYNIY